MEIVIVAFVLAAIPAMIASSKGRSPVGWYFYGLLIFPIALVHSLLISKPERAS
jgi:hypothetical protein